MQKNIFVSTRKHRGMVFEIKQPDFRGQSNQISKLFSRFFFARVHTLCSLSDNDLCQVLFMSNPAISQSFTWTRHCIICENLRSTFGDIVDIISGINHAPMSNKHSEMRRLARIEEAKQYFT